MVEAQQASEGARGGRVVYQSSGRARRVTGAKEWYAVVFTARQAQAPESKKAAALLCVTVTASNEGKSERKGSKEIRKPKAKKEKTIAANPSREGVVRGLDNMKN